MSDGAQGKAIEAAMRPMLVSLGPWGVDECHWMAAPDGEAAVWIRTRTELQRVSLEAQPWLRAQVEMMLTRLGVGYDIVSQVRLRLTSAEAQEHLFDE
ncbi:hypothetical protein [Microbacterium sp. CJ88]|uniref:hypothetical protein n=1 Tax=Microbacterium sp. CJ88 TaxID=3445672 RepID=UPI003F65CEE2